MSPHGLLAWCRGWQISGWSLGPILVAHLAAGAGLGVLYFRALRWNVRLFIQGGGLAGSLALMIGRVALLGGLMTLAALEGVGPLSALALGIFIGRFAVMRRVREEAR